MERYRQGVSFGSLQREAQLIGYGPSVGANEWRGMVREQERIQSGDRRLGPYDLIDTERAKVFRSGTMGLGPQQHPWRPDLGPREEGHYVGQPESDIVQHGMLGLRKGGLYTLDSKDRGRLGPLSILSNISNDRLSYANHARDLPSYSGLSRELRAYPGLSRDLTAHSGLSRERESYLNQHSERATYSGVSREQLTFQNLVRDLPPYMKPVYPDERRDRSPGIGTNYSRQLSPYHLLTRECSPYTDLRRDLNHMGTRHDISRLPHSPLSRYRKSRSRSPLRNRDLSSLREMLGRCQSPHSKEHPPSLFSRNLSRHEVPDGSSSRSVQSVEKDGNFGKKQPMTGSVVRIDGIPAENKAFCITQLLDHLGEYGTVTDVQLHKGSTDDYALFFYSEDNAAYVAFQSVKIHPLFSKSLYLSIWVMVADRDKPITLALTRVMYLENLEKSVSLEMLYKVCGQVGEILDIELQEKPGSFFNTAIVQYWDAQNAKIAAQALDLENLGKRVKTISGKNKPSNCVWIDGLSKDLDEHELTKHFEDYGHVDKFVFDRKRGAALILFPVRLPARQCVRYLENGKVTLGGQVIRADYANDRAQLAFCRDMEKSGQDIGNFLYA